MFNRNAPRRSWAEPQLSQHAPTRIEGPDGFEPCFVRELVDGDTIAVEHPVKPGLTEMTVNRIYRSASTIRSEMDDAQWIGTLTNGQQVHCSYRQYTPVWRMPNVIDTDTQDDAESAPFQVGYFTQV